MSVKISLEQGSYNWFATEPSESLKCKYEYVKILKKFIGWLHHYVINEVALSSEEYILIDIIGLHDQQRSLLDNPGQY